MRHIIASLALLSVAGRTLSANQETAATTAATAAAANVAPVGA